MKKDNVEILKIIYKVGLAGIYLAPPDATEEQVKQFTDKYLEKAFELLKNDKQQRKK